ncbi:MAG TPA: hypothetical protein VFB62_02535 [Polyangiaceae bacterium]|jgi:hypothetical protein|nr:hypothetical protein [Polyangiaceae bacterium]
MKYLLALALVLLVSPLFAQKSASTDEALRRAYEADELFAASKWNEAYEKFASAEAIAHSPVFVVFMGHCRRNAGRLLEAEEIYQRVADETLADNAPTPFRDAQREAERELSAVRAKIPSIVVSVSPPDAAITIDDKPATAGKAVRLDPGSHVVEAVRRRKNVRKTVSLREGMQDFQVELEFPADKSAPKEEEGSLAPGIALLVIGGAGLVLGAITGGIALGLSNEIKTGCIDDHCLVSDAEKLDTAKLLAVISTVGFAVGGAAAVTGTILVIVRPGGESSAMIGVRGRF